VSRGLFKSKNLLGFYWVFKRKITGVSEPATRQLAKVMYLLRIFHPLSELTFRIELVMAIQNEWE